MNILQAAGPWLHGVQDIPDRNARVLIQNGYAEAVTDAARAERAAETHGTAKARPGKRREVRG